jgi:glutamine synthetase
MYDFCEGQGLEIDTLIHEEGMGQMEINLLHGDAVELADQAFLFKRTVRESALRHDLYATFMAKPMEAQPGSAMHIHQSIEDLESGENILSTPEGMPNELLLSHIAGLQRYLPEAMALMTPYVNSYRRIVREMAAPINFHWDFDNRTTGFRVPDNNPKSGLRLYRHETGIETDRAAERQRLRRADAALAPLVRLAAATQGLQGIA